MTVEPLNLSQAMATPEWLENALRRHDREILVYGHEQFQAVKDVIQQGRVKAMC